MTVIETENGNTKWQVAKKNISGVQGFLSPRPRYGHRVVAVRGLILLFGGGDSGIIDDLLVYSTENGNWFQPSTNGQVPNGTAAFGMAADGTRIIIHGGMQEYGKMSNQLYELQASKWEWKKLDQKYSKGLKSIPSTRMCHSFDTLVDKVVLFGGVRNCADNPEKQFKPEYLNDVYYLELLTGSGVGAWTKPDITGVGPSPRESHSAVIYKPEGRSHMMVIYGGKDRNKRLGDLWSLDTGTNTWTELKPLGNAPPARSLHTSILVSNDRMVVIGGIKAKDDNKEIMMSNDDPSGDSIWEQDDSIHILDLNADEWIENGFSGSLSNERLPVPRSHAAAALIDTRIYLFAGKEVDKATNSMLFLETAVPNKPANLRLLKGGETSIEVAWNPVKNTDRYLVQICPMGVVDKKKKVEPKKSDPSKDPIKKNPTQTNSPKVTPTPKETPNDEASKNNFTEGNKKVEETPKTTSEDSKKTNQANPTEKTTVTNTGTSASSGDTKNEKTLEQNSKSEKDQNIKINEKTTEEKMEIDMKPENSTEDKMSVDPAPKSTSNENDEKTEDKTERTPETKLENSSTKMEAIEDKTSEDNKIQSDDKLEKAPESDSTNNQKKETDKSVASSDKEQPKIPVQLPMLPGMPLPGMKPIITPSANESEKAKDSENVPPLDGDKTPTRDEEDKEKEVIDKKPLDDSERKERTDSEIENESEKTDGEPKKEPIETKSGDKNTESDESAPKPKSEPKIEPEKAENEQKKSEKEPEKKSPTVVEKSVPTKKNFPEKEKKSEEPSWFDVALTQSTRHEIKSYFVEADKDDSGLASDEVLFLDSNKHWKKQTLGSGITYRVRICSINACGRSIFSDHSAYKTIVPGFPRAPTSIKVSKTDDGASLSWSPPVNTEIIEYSVYLAVKQHQTSGKTNNFIRVYLGDQPNCIVSHSSLAQAATNTESSNKPAVIFRIAAKNKKGYGPATQVRWLQDSRVKRQAQNIKNEAAKKAKQSV